MEGDMLKGIFAIDRVADGHPYQLNLAEFSY